MGRRRDMCPHRALTLAPDFATNPVVTCACGKQWRGVPLDFYFIDDEGQDADEPRQVDAVIADCLREGKEREAITLYLDTHWSKVKEIIARLGRE